VPRIIINIKERNKSEAQERRIRRRGKKPLGLWSLLLFVFSFLLHGESIDAVVAMWVMMIAAFEEGSSSRGSSSCS